MNTEIHKLLQKNRRSEEIHRPIIYEINLETLESTTLKQKNLVIAGGCGLNCVATGKLINEGIFEQIYVPPIPHDAGGAVGAAMKLFSDLRNKRPEPIRHAQYGPEYSNDNIELELKKWWRNFPN